MVSAFLFYTFLCIGLDTVACLSLTPSNSNTGVRDGTTGAKDIPTNRRPGSSGVRDGTTGAKDIPTNRRPGSSGVMGDIGNSKTIKAQDCKFPVRSNGFFTILEYHEKENLASKEVVGNGAIVELTCNYAFELQGFPYAMCQNGVWSDVVGECTLKPGGCIVHEKKNSFFWPSKVQIGDHFENGDQLRFYCKRGYYPIKGKSYMSCINGVWDGPFAHCLKHSNEVSILQIKPLVFFSIFCCCF